MKTAFINMTMLRSFPLLATVLTLFILSTGCNKVPDHVPKLHLTTVTTGLAAPMGVETDANGNIWVAEAGTAANDGKVVVVKPTGEKYDGIINLPSILNPFSAEVQGPAHLLYDNGVLYVLSGYYLYSINIGSFMPGDEPIDASKLQYEDVGAFVVAYHFKEDTEDSHPYNLTKGADGDLYIADAGANAIIHRTGPGTFSVLAEVPGIVNPTPVGGPYVESVPTGILYDGRNFLVTTLLGFPFPTNYARIYKVTMSGDVSVYEDGFTSLVDIAEGNFLGRLVLQHATFGPKGFEPNTGALVWAAGRTKRTLVDGLNMPTAVKQVNGRSWYITSLGDGTLLKAAYY